MHRPTVVSGLFTATLAPMALSMIACHGGTDEPQTVTAVPVGTTQVTRDSLVEEIAVVGRLTPVPGHAAMLNAPAAGVVRRVAVQLGAAVQPGQLIVELDVPELVATARQQAVTAAQARREAERQRQLFADGVTSRRQLEEAEAAAQAADDAAAASSQLLAQTNVASPIAGRVQQILVQQGTRVDPGTRLAEIIASDQLDLSGAVPIAQLARVHRTQPARVTAYGDVVAYRGRVEAVAPAVDTLTNAGQVLVRVPNTAEKLRAGSGATARIAVGVRRDVLVVPDAALVIVGDSTAVFVISEDSTVHQRTVILGERQAGRVEVHGKLKDGDRVVTTGAAGLQDGMHVVPDSGAHAKAEPATVSVPR